MLNKIILMGRLTRDPELRRTGSGTAVTSFTLAVDRDFKGQNGEKETDFIDVTVWRNTAEFVSKYFTKGRMAVVEGRLQIREWEKDGQKRRNAEVVADNVYFGDAARGSQDAQGFQEVVEEDGELPF
jgi:single-strand DNA-binding protein